MNSVLRYILAFVAAVVVFAPMEDTSAQSREDGTITVVQPKPVLRRQRVELVPRVSWTFSDPVTQSFGVGGSLYYNVSERFSLGPTFEWFDFGPKLRGTTGRYDDVIDTTSYVPQYVLLDYYGGLDFTYVPAYGKFVSFGSISYFDVYITLGAGVVRNQARDISPAGVAAVGARIYFNRWLGVSLEYRHRLSGQQLAHKDSKSVWSTGSVALGLNILMPFNFKYKHEEGDR